MQPVLITRNISFLVQTTSGFCGKRMPRLSRPFNDRPDTILNFIWYSMVVDSNLGLTTLEADILPTSYQED